MDLIQPWVGKKGEDWKWLSLTSFIFSQDTGLNWHRDAAMKTGGFNLYIHPEWHPSWGGELIFADPGTRGAPLPKLEVPGKNPKVIGPWLGNRAYEEKLMEMGMGFYVMPKPNRVVALGRDVDHAVRRVDRAAGSSARCTITGFFHSFNPLKNDPDRFFAIVEPHLT